MIEAIILGFTLCSSAVTLSGDPDCFGHESIILVNSREFKYSTAWDLCKEHDTKAFRKSVTSMYDGYKIKYSSCKNTKVYAKKELANDLMTSGTDECKEYNPDRKHTCLEIEVIQ